MKLRKALEKLVAKGQAIPEMAAKLGIPEREVFFHLDAMGISPQETAPVIISKARVRDGSLVGYFRKNADKSFQDMAKDLEVAHSTVEQYYQIFAKTIGE